MQSAMTVAVLLLTGVAADVSLSAAVSATPAAVRGAGLAAASPPEYISARQQQVMREQAPYQELDVKVKRLAPDRDDTPLTGTLVDLEHHKFHVYWVGVVPRGARELRSWAAQHGITLVITQAAFTKRELTTAANQISAFARSTGARLEIALDTDGSGITVRSTGLSAAVSDSATPTKAQAALLGVIANVRARTGVPVTVEDLPGSAKWAASRDADTSPYWGGAQANSSSNWCTSGFSAYASGDPSMRHMLTVAHCIDWRDGTPVYNGAGHRMGVSDFIAETYDAFRPNPGYDLATIRLDPGKSNEPKIYSNYYSTSPHTVWGFASNGIPPGLTYCVSANKLTPRCNLRSGAQHQFCFNYHCHWYVGMDSTDGRAMYCQGDSGGPIYYWDPSWQGIYAAGLVGWGVLQGADACALSGGVSVVATAWQLIPGLVISADPPW